MSIIKITNRNMDEIGRMMGCTECKDKGYCTWCGGSGRERSALLCRSCHGSGICLMCGGKKINKHSSENIVKTKRPDPVVFQDPFTLETVESYFEDIDFLMRRRAVSSLPDID